MATIQVAVTAGTMTQQYLAGELSLLLGELHIVTTNEASARDVARLRYEAEKTPPTALRSVTVRALALTDGLCWDSLARADTATFSRQATVSAELHEFGVCAGLLDEE
jgi:hypothetical protein